MARALFNELTVALGRDLRFMDVGRDALAVLIGNDWLDATTSTQQRRLDDPEDYVRREIEAALRRNISITPVLLDGAAMPRAEQLPDAIREFAYYSGLELGPSCWADNVRELFKRLGLAVQPNAETVGDAVVSTQWVPSTTGPAPLRPAAAPSYVGPRSAQWHRVAMAGAAMLAVVAAGAHYFRLGGEDIQPRAEVQLAEVVIPEAPLPEASRPEPSRPEAPLPEAPPDEAPPDEALLEEAPSAEATLAGALLTEEIVTQPPHVEAPLAAAPRPEPARTKVSLAQPPALESPFSEIPLPEAALPEIPLPDAPPIEEALTEEPRTTPPPPADAPRVELPLAVVAPAEVQLSDVPLTEAQLADVRPSERDAIKMNSRITLRSPDNRYVVNARSRENYYYASLGSTAQVMALEAGDTPLVDGGSVTIKATENWGDEWAGRTYLGAFGDRTELYYWDYYGAKTQWIIEKVSGQRGDPIHSGDKVTIQNERFTGQYLTTHPNNYLTTTNRTPRAEWTIELAN